jgi:hypothetical protein
MGEFDSYTLIIRAAVVSFGEPRRGGHNFHAQLIYYLWSFDTPSG